MSKHLQFCIAVFLCVSLACCKEQKAKDRLKNSINQSAGEVPDSFTPIETVDTLFMPDAPSRITRKIRMNKEGNLLMAAFTDVVRYDGESFSKLPKPDGFESFDAFDALEDSKGNVWIASTHYGVFRFDGANFKHFTTEDGLAHNRTMDIHEDSAGNIWIATMGGLSCYNGNSFRTFTTKEGLPHNDVNTIMEDRAGKLWLGTRGTACLFDPASSTFTKITNKEGKPLANVRSIIEDSQGAVWLINKEGVWRSVANSVSRISSYGGVTLCADKNGGIWFTSENSLYFLSKESLKPGNSKAREVFIGKGIFFGISEDKEGNIWVGTLQGVFNYDGKSIHYFEVSES